MQNSKTLLSYAHDMGSPAISYFYPNGRNKNRQECVIGLPERNHKNAKKGRKLIRPDNHRKWLEEAVDGLKWIIPTELKCQQNEVEECYGLTYGCTKIEGEGVGEILGERCGWHISPYRVDPHAPPADTSD